MIRKKVVDKKKQEVFSNDSQNQIGQDQSAFFSDNRPETIFQRKLQENANKGSQISQLTSLQNLANTSQQSSKLIQMQSAADQKTPRPKRQRDTEVHQLQTLAQTSVNQQVVQRKGVYTDVSRLFEKKVKTSTGSLYKRLKNIKDPEPDEQLQFEADIKIWEKTLHQDLKNDDTLSEDEKLVHSEQMQVIKRDLISRAFLGVKSEDGSTNVEDAINNKRKGKGDEVEPPKKKSEKLKTFGKSAVTAVGGGALGAVGAAVGAGVGTLGGAFAGMDKGRMKGANFFRHKKDEGMIAKGAKNAGNFMGGALGAVGGTVLGAVGGALGGAVAGGYKGGKFVKDKVFGKNKKKSLDPVDVPLAALLSHGDRHAYQSNDAAVGEAFRHELMFGGKNKVNVEVGHAAHGVAGLFAGKGSGSRAMDPRKRVGDNGNDKHVHAGFYERQSSHQQHRDPKTGKFEELKGNPASLAGKYLNPFDSGAKYKTEKFAKSDTDSLGMNIPLGGVGRMATHHDDAGTFKHEIGTEGAMIDPATGKVKKGKQHGHAYFKHNRDDKGTSTMVGYEGSAPSHDSMFGSHGLMSMVPGMGNKQSLTGQDKGKELGMSLGLGGVKSEVTEEKLERLKEVFRQFEALEGSKDPKYKERANELLSELLKATNEDQRIAAIKMINTAYEKMLDQENLALLL